jgi:predicted anti-sigma-YlaC factor YlaD
VSLSLDDELSELEQAQLWSHLAVCGDCRDFRAQIAPATAALRTAPLEALEHRIVLPPRRAIGFRALQVGAAAAVVAMAGAASLLVGPLRSESRVHVPVAGASLTSADSLRQIQRSIRRQENIPSVPVGKAGGRLPA